MVKEQYRVTRHLKTGGMGHVSLVYDFGNRDYCALKYPIRRKEPDDDIRQEKLVLEAAVLSRLAHPGIIRYRDSFYQEDKFFLALDYIHGFSLNSLLANYKPEPEQLRGWVRQLILALWYLHSQRVVFRDLKPSNVMAKEDNRIILLDFGGALVLGHRAAEDSTASIFTPVYAAPEMIRDNRADFRSDIFSLGATVYFLLTGQNPPRCTPERQNLDPAALSAGLPSSLCALVRRSTSYDPLKRFRDAGDLYSHFEYPDAQGRHQSATAEKPAEVAYSSSPPAMVAKPRLVLQVEAGKKVINREFELSKVVMTIGRSATSGVAAFHSPDIAVEDPFVSLSPKQPGTPWGHARVATEFDTNTGEHSYYLEDLGSTNQTFANDQVVTSRVKLKHGDRVRLGPDTVFMFKFPDLPGALRT